MGVRLVWVVLTIVVTAIGATAQMSPVQITFGDCRDRDPKVSPNGDHLAFSSDRTGNFDIYMHTFGKQGVYQLTQSKKDDRYPSWSADNRKIIFTSKRTGNGDLYETTADGSGGYLQLSDGKRVEEFPSYGNGGVLFAIAGEKRIRLRPQMSVVFSGQTRMANNPRVLAEGDEPRFAPNGRKVAFVSHRTDNNDIWLMNPDGGSQMQLTTDPKDDENPHFSPDSRRIVFASNRTGNYDIWVMDADGGNQRQLTSDPSDETQPCWSSGGYVYFVYKYGEGKSNIFRIKAP